MMASSSPSVGKGKGGIVRAEASTRAMVNLHRANAQLQQELDKIDRQAFTAVSNIANHQQAMKMSWRRLEAQRNSPKVARGKSEPSSEQQQSQRKGLLMSSNKTRLYVSATPQIYSGQVPEQQSGETENEVEATGDRRPSTRDDSELGGFSGLSSRLTTSSPYVSSPFMYRRSSGPETSASPLVSSSSSPSFKLPPIPSSNSQPSLVATTNKDTLLKVSHMMGLDSQSHGPKSFRGFYTDRALARFGAVQTAHEESETGGGERGEMGEQREGEEEDEGKELTLAQKMEKIKSCRYIRHYRPDGTAVDEPYELFH